MVHANILPQSKFVYMRKVLSLVSMHSVNELIEHAYYHTVIARVVFGAKTPFLVPPSLLWFAKG